MFVECVLPYATKYFSKDPDGKSKKDDDRKEKGHLTAEAELEAYDSFGESQASAHVIWRLVSTLLNSLAAFTNF